MLSIIPIHWKKGYALVEHNRNPMLERPFGYSSELRAIEVVECISEAETLCGLKDAVSQSDHRALVMRLEGLDLETSRDFLDFTQWLDMELPAVKHITLL